MALGIPIVMLEPIQLHLDLSQAHLLLLHYRRCWYLFNYNCSDCEYCLLESCRRYLFYYSCCFNTSRCLSCIAGTYSSTDGAASSTVCLNCRAGTYNPNLGSPSSSSCVNCAPGTYVVSTGSPGVSFCTTCGSGRYSTTSGASLANVCLTCVAGTSSSVFSATS